MFNTMASGIEKPKHDNLTVCSICFENFRTPRILPCTHVFCHGCISSYIVTSCQTKEAPVGFSCPLCREFVSSPTDLSNPEKWADRLPGCEMLDKLNKDGDANLCLPCLRENEEVKATEFCFTCEESICENCTKFHKRILTTRSHLTCKLSDSNLVMQFVNLSLNNDRCPDHTDKKVKLYCNDHSKVCCTLCATTGHRKCADVQTIQSAVAKTKEMGDTQALITNISDFRQELLTVKQNQEVNLTELDKTSDSMIEETKKLREEINAHLDKLEKEHLDEISVLAKKYRDILSKAIDSVSDRIQFSNQCLRRLDEIGNKSNACFLKEYQEIKESFKSLEEHTRHLDEHKVTFKSSVSAPILNFQELTRFSSINVNHSKNKFKMKNFDLSETFEESNEMVDDDIYDDDLWD